MISQALAEAAQRELDLTTGAGQDLAAYYAFQGNLMEIQERAKDGIAATLELVDAAILKTRLQQRLPLVPFSQLPIEESSFAEQSLALARALTDYYGDSPNTPCGQKLNGQALPATAAEWIAIAEKRFVENRAGQTDPSPPITLAETTVDLALRPYLAWVAERVMPYVDQEAWTQSYCPVCGAAPDLAFLEQEVGARHLVCARCDSTWRYPRLGCPFCETQDRGQIVYYPSDDEVYRLYVCQACRRYLKTLDLRKASSKVVLPLERITSVELDVAAREHGYR
jgi:hypothetical protein